MYKNRSFIFGDLHGNSNNELKFIDKKNFPDQKGLTKEDVFIQLGDFGYVWYYEKTAELYKKDMHHLNLIANKKFTTLVVPGNHENYDIINSLPIVDKWGGKVYELKLKDNSIFFAIRGEIYIINGKKYFTFSGATTSTTEGRFSYADYESGEKFKKKKYRYGELKKIVMEKVKLKEVAFWHQEISTAEEKQYALDNLKKHDFKVDGILTHTPPNFVVHEILERTDKYKNSSKFNCDTAIFLDIIAKKTEFKNWYFGHLHLNKIFIHNNNNYICHYKDTPTEITDH
jgi:hypothetical protein